MFLCLGMLLLGILGVSSQLQCPICEDGTAIPPEFVDVVISSEAYGSAACPALPLPLTQALFEDCYVTQVLAGFYCGCNVPEPAEGDERCLLCADGSVPPLESSTNRIEKGYTCGDGGIDSLYELSGHEDCPWYHSMGYLFCGCPTPPPPSEERCSFCADGSALSLDFSANQIEKGFTCADALGGSLYEAPDHEDCPWYQAMGYIFCGCPTPPPPSEERCSFCADGSALPLEFSSTIIEEGYTCAEAVGDSIYVSPDHEDCPWYQAMGYMFCGCPTPPPPSEERCSLCTGDSASVWPDPDQLTSAVDPSFSCRDILNDLLYLDPEDPDCGGHQALAATHCGCPALDRPSCPMCGESGEVGNPAGILETGFSCRNAEVYTSGFDPTTAFCTVLQATYGVYCGCTDPDGSPSYDVTTQDAEANICRICGPPGSRVTAADPLELVLDLDTSSFSCAAVETLAAYEAIEFPAAGCVVPSEAFATCCDSAMACSNDASKGTKVTFLQKIKGDKVSCADIAASPDKDLYCQSFAKLKKACRLTCDACRKRDDPCLDDDSKTFKAYKFLEKDCPWLAKGSASRKKKFCRLSSEAQEMCPRSCGTCP